MSACVHVYISLGHVARGMGSLEALPLQRAANMWHI